jgi:phosphate transport system ATP-binding protein
VVDIAHPLARATQPSVGTHELNGQRVKIRASGVSFYYGRFRALNDVSLTIAENKITAMIGPSGCGKSTLLQIFNRMYELTPGTRVSGSVKIGHEEITTTTRLQELRRRVGIVFQRANRLHRSAQLLSGGQQQRLCIARCIAITPEVILMDEPCSALDPISTLRVEELIKQLAQRYTIVIVTHNMQQARRVADYTAFLLIEPFHRYGELVEFAPTADLFSNPVDGRTADYVSGRFG